MNKRLDRFACVSSLSDLTKTKPERLEWRMGNVEWENEEWGIGNGEWGIGNGEWGMRNGEWGMRNEEWRVRNRRWGMGNGEWENKMKNWKFIMRNIYFSSISAFSFKKVQWQNILGYSPGFKRGIFVNLRRLDQSRASKYLMDYIRGYVSCNIP